jgi:hypothetical protein
MLACISGSIPTAPRLTFLVDRRDDRLALLGRSTMSAMSAGEVLEAERARCQPHPALQVRLSHVQ